jgi:hypothetical protein
VQRYLIRCAMTMVGAAALLFGLMAPSALAATPAAAKPAPSDTTNAPALVAGPDALSDCPAGSLCFWNNTGFTDGPGKLAGTNSSWFAFSHSTCPSGTWADCASSIYNHGNSCTARVWFFTGFGSPSMTISRGTSISDLSTRPVSGTTWNNNIEGNDWIC